MTADKTPTDAEILEVVNAAPALVGVEPVANLTVQEGKIAFAAIILPDGLYDLYTAPQPVGRVPLTHAQAKALVSRYGNDPLHLVYQVEVAHGIKGGQHGAE